MACIDVLIPTKNRHACLRRSLPSLITAAAGIGANIIVCDQSAEPFHADGIIIHHCPSISSLPAARNYLLAVSQAEVVLFLDDDTDIAPDFLIILQHIIISEPLVVAWGPVIETRTLWIRRLHRLAHIGVFRDPRRQTAGASNHFTTMLFGCCFAVRRTVARSIGFDQRRAGYALGEDADFFWRLAQQGYRMRFSARLHATHRRDGHDRATMYQRGVAKGRFLQWWARRHGRQNPCTIIHLLIAVLAAASGFGAEPAQWRGVVCGLADPRQ